jgi:hypothetical protein
MSCDIVAPKVILPQAPYTSSPTAKGMYTELWRTPDSTLCLYVAQRATNFQLRPVEKANIEVGLQPVVGFKSDSHYSYTYSPLDPPAARDNQSTNQSTNQF